MIFEPLLHWCEGGVRIWLVGGREEYSRLRAGQIAGLRRAELMSALFTAVHSHLAWSW